MIAHYTNVRDGHLLARTFIDNRILDLDYDLRLVFQSDKHVQWFDLNWHAAGFIVWEPFSAWKKLQSLFDFPVLGKGQSVK